MKLVSVIIPVYNVEQYLQECIASVQMQTYKNIEILLIDDGSTDTSGILCDSYAASDNRIRVYHHANYGVSHARNCGLDEARGEYIAFCDADDAFCPDFLVKMVSALEQNNADIVISSFYLRRKEKLLHPYPYQYEGSITEEYLSERIFLRNEIGGFVFNKLFRKSIIKNVRFDEKMQICEDTYFLYSVLENAMNIYLLKTPLYIYTSRDGSAVHNIENLFTPQNELKYAKVFKKILIDFTFSDYVKRLVYSGIVLCSVSSKCNYLMHGGKDKEIIKNLNSDIKKFYPIFIMNRRVPFVKKMIVTGNWLFNLRRMKNRFWVNCN